MIRHALVALAMAFAAYAQAPVEGQLTVDSQTTKLTQAYAYSAEGFFDKKMDDTVVLLTSAPVTAAQVRDGFALRRLAEEGKLCFVQETINANGQIINFTVGHRAFKAPPSGGSTEHVFEGKIQGRMASGKVSTRGMQRAFGGVSYEYAATFKTAVAAAK